MKYFKLITLVNSAILLPLLFLFQYHIGNINSKYKALLNENASILKSQEEITSLNDYYVKDVFSFENRVEATSLQNYKYFPDWNIYSIGPDEPEYNFGYNNCFVVQYPDTYSLTKDKGYLSLKSENGNEVDFAYDSSFTTCANQGCVDFNIVDLPSNIVQNYSKVQIIGRDEQQSLGFGEKYFIEAYLGKGYGVRLESLNKNDFENQLEILSTVTLSESCSYDIRVSPD